MSAAGRLISPPPPGGEGQGEGGHTALLEPHPDPLPGRGGERNRREAPMAAWTSPSRRESLKASGLGAASLLGPRRAAAQPAAPARMRAPEANPKRGGTLRTAWGVTTPHFDMHQGATMAVMCHMYNGL